MQTRYDQIISEFVKQTTLKRIRVKTDPRADHDFAHAAGYEGFVLEEDDMGNIVAFIPDAGDNNVIDVPFGSYSPCAQQDEHENPQLELLKNHVISALIDSEDIEEGDPGVENIMVINNIHQLHDYLDQKGIDDEKMLDILKSFFDYE
jgi:hypothetical protein